MALPQIVGTHSMGDVLDPSSTVNMMSGIDMDMSMGFSMDLDHLGSSYADAGNSFNPMSLDPQNGHGSFDSINGALVSGNNNNNNNSNNNNHNNSNTENDNNHPETDMSGVGAGPLPTGFGIAPQNGNSTLTEFTKRRNWSQRVIEELKDFLHILTPDGRILYVSPSCKNLTGYTAQQLVGRFIGEFVHPDDSGIFMREFNESIASSNPLRFFYRFKKEDGTYLIFECDGHPHISSDTQGNPYGAIPGTIAVSQVSALCKGFFMMARPYPTKNAALLDSFLEHKIENERLLKKIADLKREEAEENEQQERQWRDQSVAASQQRDREVSETVSRQADDSRTDAAQATDYQGMPPPARPTNSNTALTRQNLDSVLSAQRPDSMADKMSRYEGSNHLETIEMLTGLRYRDGERSHGISTGDTSPALIRGDAGIAILLDRDRDGQQKDKKKKIKMADEYVCADCGTLDSPEWRKGPKGPKTLCNACGLRWAKKEKKRHGGDSGGGSQMGKSAGPGHPSLGHQNSGDSM